MCEEVLQLKPASPSQVEKKIVFLRVSGTQGYAG